MNTLKFSKQQIKYLKIKTVGFKYFLFVLSVFVIYLIANFLIGFLLFQYNPSQGILGSLAPLYSCESLILTFFACSKLSQRELTPLPIEGKGIDLINVLALTTAVIATICSFSLDHPFLSLCYFIITLGGFWYLTKEAVKDYRISKRLKQSMKKKKKA